MISVQPTSYNGQPPWKGYYIDIGSLTVYVSRRKGWGWLFPNVKLIRSESSV